MGKDTEFPKETEGWAKVVCEDMDFLTKKEVMTDCSMRKYTPTEQSLYMTNLNVSTSYRSPHTGQCIRETLSLCTLPNGLLVS